MMIICRQGSNHGVKYGLLRYMPSTCSRRLVSSGRYLVCGDGDLSFSSSISEELANKGIHLTASVLESSDNHRQVYSDSQANARQIESFGHEVRYDTDATKLPDIFVTRFDRIQFNFPHWKGKANIRYNRLLLNDFFGAAAQVIDPSGSIDVALMAAQAGMKAATVEDWKRSWKPAFYAADHNLLLVSVKPFKPTYNLSSYRSQDKNFGLKDPSLFTFVPPGGTQDCVAPIGLELFCHFEVHLESDEDNSLDLETFFNEQLESRGWRAEAHFRDFLQGRGRAYKIIFFGSRQAITREAADEVRLRLISELAVNGFPYIARGAWAISNPCPASMLPRFLNFVIAEPKSELIRE